MCSLCERAAETTHHLFCYCRFAKEIWCQLGSVLQLFIDTTSIHSILLICDRNWSSQTKDVVLTGIINVIWVVWYCRNKLRFEDKNISVRAVINMIVANVSLFGNLSNGIMTSSIQDFMILKAFSIIGKPRKAPSFKQVIWYHPACNWFKSNTNGTAKENLGPVGCGGISINHIAEFLGCFGANLGITNSLHAELFGTMFAIELAY